MQLSDSLLHPILIRTHRRFSFAVTCFLAQVRHSSAQAKKFLSAALLIKWSSSVWLPPHKFLDLVQLTRFRCPVRESTVKQRGFYHQLCSFTRRKGI